MPRIVFIGAGSFGFTRVLVRDILTFPLLEGSTLVLMDIDENRLRYITKAVKMIVAKGKYPAKVVSTTDRKAALKGADAVVCTILAGGVGVWRHDIEIPKKYGVDFNVGDTRGIAGMIRALRTIPVMLSICRDIERLCPDAIFLNYTNPMAMLCNAMQTATTVNVTGLCHSVQGTAGMLANWIGAKMEDVTYTCAGINHQAWYVDYRWKGKDAYPLIRKAVAGNERIYREEIVRNEMFLHLGYYVTESSGHNSEYNWWFRKRPDLIDRYCTDGTGWNPGVHAYILDEYRKAETNWEAEIRKWLKAGKVDLNRGHEYAAYIMNAWLGDTPYRFHGNVPNADLITNLPREACVEVPVVVSRRKLESAHVGALPPQLVALNHVNAMLEIMTVQASLTGDPGLVFQAALYDPASASVCSMKEIRDMVRELLVVNKPWLPQFKKVKI
jgi:alpha-galactosidase